MVELEVQDFNKNKKIFDSVKDTIISALGNVEVHHVGSTAIPDMIGKSIIDVLVGVDSEDSFSYCSKKLQELGYCPSANSKTNIYQFFASKDVETTSGDVHIHLCIMGTDRYNEFIILRDYLLVSKKEVRAYIRCKQDILSEGNLDRHHYRNTKSAYVSALILRAKEYFKNKKV